MDRVIREIPETDPENLGECLPYTLAEALCDSANVINQTLNLSTVLEHILDVIGKVVPHDSANIMLVEGLSTQVLAWRGLEQFKNVTSFGQWRMISEVPNLQRMVTTQQPILVPNTEDDLNWVYLNTSSWIRSYVSSPICRNGKVIGFINLNSSKRNFFTNIHAERLIAFSNQAAIAIENARLYEKVQQAMNDLETRVEQRTSELRYANEQLNMELARRQQAEQALEEERALLAMRIEQRTAELSLANTELAKAARLKDAFLASMSHELRTPLSAILNIAETLRERIFGPLSEAQENALHTIEQSGEHLLLLINDILDFSKIGAGKLELVMDIVDVDSVCQSSLLFVQDTVKKKGLSVSYHKDSGIKTIWADSRRLKQILGNLLSNAVKFTPEGGAVGLTVTGDRVMNQVKFTIWDQGIGISDEQIPLLFRPFNQLDNSLSRHYEGAGLGLALVYSLIELHSGSIHLDTEPGKGSAFTVTLNWEEEKIPLAVENLDGISSYPSLASIDPEGKDPISYTRRLCNELGIQTDGFWFEDPSIQKAIDAGYDLFILDVRLLSSGRSFLAKIKSNHQMANIPVILISRSSRMLDRPTLPIGTSFLEFPFTAQQLTDAIYNFSTGYTGRAILRAAILIERNEFDPQMHPMILLGDDNLNSKRVLSNHLNALGYRLSFATSGAEVIERAREVHPDLILLDIQIPGIDGLMIIKRIRHDPLIKSIPIVAMTAISTPTGRMNCLNAGANEFLIRPLILQHLTEVVAKHIQSSNQGTRLPVRPALGDS